MDLTIVMTAASCNTARSIRAAVAPTAMRLRRSIYAASRFCGDRGRRAVQSGIILTVVHSVHTLEDMSSAYVSGRVPARYERLVTKQARAARTSKSDLVARYVIEKCLETEFPGISFRDSLSGREAYLTGHRVAVWEVLAVHEETNSVEKTASHFRWPRVLVKRALAYAKAFPDEIMRARGSETDTASVVG